MSPTMDKHEHTAVCAQIESLRARLENAVLSDDTQEALRLSRQLDALINRLLLSPRHALRKHYRFSAVDAHVYTSRVRAHSPHPRRAAGRSHTPHTPQTPRAGAPV